MSLFSKIRDTVTNPSTLVGSALGGGVGGATGSTALGNVVTGKPVGSGLVGAGGLDLAGLGIGLGAGGFLGAGLGLGLKGLGLAGAGGSDSSWGANPQSGGGIFDTFGNLLPAAGGAYLGNRQRQDAMSQVGKINELGDSLGGQGSAYLKSITDPYDQQTGLGRTNLSQSLVQRGVGGSSFGNQQLENYDYMRGLGRGDLGTRAQVGLAGLQGGLYGNALTGINEANKNYNQILGAGLGASGSLFNRSAGSGPKLPSGFNLSSLSGLGNAFGNGLTGIGSGLGNVFGSPGSSLWGTGGSGLPDAPGFVPEDLFTSAPSEYSDLFNFMG